MEQKREVLICQKKAKEMTVYEIAFFLCPATWDKVFNGLKEEFKILSDFLQTLSDQKSGMKGSWIFYPRKPDLFRGLNYCPFPSVKVLILGESPYPGMQGGRPEACGMSFAVRKGFTIPRSQKNVLTEVYRDYPLPSGEDPDYSCGDLIGWAKQGVLLINASGTFLPLDEGDEEDDQESKKDKKKKQIQDKQWYPVVSRILDRISKRRGIVAMFWGQPAQKYKGEFNKSGNLVLTASHPSPWSYANTEEPFKGCGHFKKANDFLVKEGREPVDWHKRF